MKVWVVLEEIGQPTLLGVRMTLEAAEALAKAELKKIAAEYESGMAEPSREEYHLLCDADFEGVPDGVDVEETLTALTRAEPKGPKVISFTFPDLEGVYVTVQEGELVEEAKTSEDFAAVRTGMKV